MNARVLPARITLVVAVLICLSCATLAAEDHGGGGGGGTRGTGGDVGNGVSRSNVRIGNFRGGHLGASSFGDGSAPGQIPATLPNPGSAPVATPGSNNPRIDSQTGAGFLGRYTSGNGGASDAARQGSDSSSSSSRATFGAAGTDRPTTTVGGNKTADQGIPNFPRRFGNTELRQWETGAGVNVDPAYSYWAGWGTSVGMMEYLWGNPLFGYGMGGYGMGGYGMGALGMPGMTFPNQYGGSGYGPAPGYSNGGFPGPNTNSAYDQSGTTGTAPDSASIGSAASIESPGPQSNSSERAPLGSAPQPQSTLTTGSDAASARVFAEKGEKLFRSGDYKGAVYQWKHAVVDDPQNGVLAMMLAQSLFATGQYDDAAGATQVAMRLLPRDQWGVVITNRKELYGEPRVYLDQLQTLDKAIKGKPSDPAFRFLAGFHYACLGYPRAAVDNLDKGLKVAPQDELARRLRDEMQARLPKSTTPPTPQPPPTSSAADAPSPEASKKSTSAR